MCVWESLAKWLPSSPPHGLFQLDLVPASFPHTTMDKRYCWRKPRLTYWTSIESMFYDSLAMGCKALHAKCINQHHVRARPTTRTYRTKTESPGGIVKQWAMQAAGGRGGTHTFEVSVLKWDCSKMYFNKRTIKGDAVKALFKLEVRKQQW